MRGFPGLSGEAFKGPIADGTHHLQVGAVQAKGLVPLAWHEVALGRLIPKVLNIDP